MKRPTKIMIATDLRKHRSQLEQGAAVLREGGLVVFATETVYGIGANALNPEAVAGIFEAKGRPQDNPLIVHIARMKELPALTREIPEQAKVLAKRFWPGPLTMVLPRSPLVPDVVSAGLDTVAVRMPAHPVARALINLAKVPVAAPSANLSGSPSPTTARHCVNDLKGRVDIILDSGPCGVGVESTVISLAGERPRLLRPGAVTLEQLREVLGAVEVDPAVYKFVEPDGPVASPGMKYKHYAPKARLWLVHGEFDTYCKLLEEKKKKGVYALVFEGDAERIGVPCVTYGEENNPDSQAERLFAALRELDEAGAEQVYVRAPNMDGIGLAVYNRIVRASAFTEVYLDI